VVGTGVSWPLPEGTKHWHESKAHGAIAAMEAVSLTTGKVVRLPPLQHKLEPLSSTLHGTR